MIAAFVAYLLRLTRNFSAARGEGFAAQMRDGAAEQAV